MSEKMRQINERAWELFKTEYSVEAETLHDVTTKSPSSAAASLAASSSKHIKALRASEANGNGGDSRPGIYRDLVESSNERSKKYTYAGMNRAIWSGLWASTGPERTQKTLATMQKKEDRYPGLQFAFMPSRRMMKIPVSMPAHRNMLFQDKGMEPREQKLANKKMLPLRQKNTPQGGGVKQCKKKKSKEKVLPHKNAPSQDGGVPPCGNKHPGGKISVPGKILPRDCGSLPCENENTDREVLLDPEMPHSMKALKCGKNDLRILLLEATLVGENFTPSGSNASLRFQFEVGKLQFFFLYKLRRARLRSNPKTCFMERNGVYVEVLMPLEGLSCESSAVVSGASYFPDESLREWIAKESADYGLRMVVIKAQILINTNQNEALIEKFFEGETIPGFRG